MRARVSKGEQTVVGKRQKFQRPHAFCSIRPARRHAQQFILSEEFLHGVHTHTHTHRVLRLEDVHGPHHILPADGALTHPLSTLGAGDHVTTFQ